MFSQTTEYALRAMACLAAAPNELIPTNVLAQRANVPPNYLAKVLQQLANAELIEGRRGVGGGYRLARPPNEINLLDIVRVVSSVQVQEPSCFNQTPSVNTLVTTLSRVKSMVASALEGVTLDALVEGQPQPSGPLPTDG